MTSTAAASSRPTRSEAAGYLGGLFERHARMVYGVCRAMLRDVHDAEDATQQVFLSAHTALLGGAAVRNPAAWLATIARNECRARIAAGMREPLPVAEQDLDLLPAVGDEQLRRLQLEELRTALARLPERQRQAVALRYLYGLRYAEVATALGLSRPATEALLFRARRALRLRLRPVVGTALVVPSALRDELALALPGFGGRAGAGAAAAGVTGGLIAKLTVGPVGVKVATSAAAISSVGAVGAVPSEQAHRADHGVAIVVASAADRAPRTAADSKVEHENDSSGTSTSSGSGRSGRREGGETEDRSGSDGPGKSNESSGPSEPSRSGTVTPAEPEEHRNSNSGPSSRDSDSEETNSSQGSGSSSERSGSSGEGSGSSDESRDSSGPSD